MSCGEADINNASSEVPITAEVKGGDSYNFLNYGKFILPTNKLPKVDPSDGFGRRVRDIPFDNVFNKDKDVISTIPKVEFENLARKILIDSKKLWQNRSFDRDKLIQERIQNYQEISKTKLEKFIGEYYDTGNSEDMVLFSDFYLDYTNYLKSIKEIQVSRIVFGKALRKLGYVVKNYNWKVEIDNGVHSYDSNLTIFGLKLKGGLL